MADKAPFEFTDGGIAATRGKLTNRESARVDSARQAHGMAPVPAELRAKATGRGVTRQPPPCSNGKGPSY